MKKVFTICAAFLFYLSINTVALAYTAPAFPSCVNPQGSIRASYSSGLHGVPGIYENITGTDSVYEIDGAKQLIQCLCSSNGKGTQTDWLVMPVVSDAELQLLQGQGWIHIHDGAMWGLDPSDYLARNSEYNCVSTDPGSNKTSSGSSNSSSSSSSESTSTIQNVLAATALANTGNTYFITLTGAIGLALIFFGSIIVFASREKPRT